MANKRSLKRSITLISEELFAECVAASLYGQNPESAEALIFSIIKMQDHFIRRISHPEPGIPAGVYYRWVKSLTKSTRSENYVEIILPLATLQTDGVDCQYH